MTWRDQLLPASLNGVEFLYREVNTKGGRRTVAFEFPGRLEPFVEDLGPSAKKYHVSAFLLGDNYNVARDNLTDVLDSPGPLNFQHPYRGLFQVQLLGDYEVIESDTKGGMAEVRFTLHQSGLSFPLVAVDTAADVANLAATAQAALAENTRFSLLGAIQDVVSSVTSAINALNSKLRAVNGKIGAALGTVDSITAAITDLDNQLTTLLNSPQSLMTNLIGLKTALVGLVKDFIPPTIEVGVEAEQFPLGDILIDALADVTELVLEPSVIPTNTPQGQQEAEAIAELNLNNRAGMVAATADGVASVELESADDAEDILAALVVEFDAVLGTEDLDPEIYEAFAALKGATVRHLTVQQQNLPLLAELSPPQTVPALVLAYQLYGDATRESEIVRRNKIRHPGFVPGGRPLEIVSPGD